MLDVSELDLTGIDTTLFEQEQEQGQDQSVSKSSAKKPLTKDDLDLEGIDWTPINDVANLIQTKTDENNILAKPKLKKKELKLEELDLTGIDINPIKTQAIQLPIEEDLEEDIIKVNSSKLPLLVFEAANSKDFDLSLEARLARSIATNTAQNISSKKDSVYTLGKPVRLKFNSYQEASDRDTVIDKFLENLGGDYVNLNKEVRNKTGRNLIDIRTGDVVKPVQQADGSFESEVAPTRMSIELLNAYREGGMEGARKKHQELQEEERVRNDELRQIADKEMVFRRNHPYISKIDQSLKSGVNKGLISYTQLIHNFRILPEALHIAATKGFDSQEYEDLIRRDMKQQQMIDASSQALPETAEGFGYKAVEGLTSGLLQLPKFAVAGKVSPFTLPALAVIENYHRGNREAILAGLPMAVMAGSGRGLEQFVAGEAASFNGMIRKSLSANDDFITSISQTAKGNQPYLIVSSEGLVPKVVKFDSISPIQRQLLMRGQNAITNFGTAAVTDPNFNVEEGFSQLVIGLGMPVGKYNRRSNTSFERPSILSGDAYTLPDGSVLLQAPIDTESGLVQGRIPQDAPATYNPLVEKAERIKGYLPPASIEGNATGVTRFNFGKKQINLQEKQRSLLLDLDTAALNLLDLRRALRESTYLEPIKDNDLGVPNLLSDRMKGERIRREDLENAIKVLDSAIPKDTQKFFEQHEEVIREALRTNYEQRIQKEEFIRGNKILRKSEDKVSTADNRPFNPTSRKAESDNFIQRTRRSLVTIEENGRKGLEANKKNKGTLNVGVDISDLPYLTEIAIGKLGQKGLDFAEFSREMIAEFGDSAKDFLNKVYTDAQEFIANRIKKEDYPLPTIVRARETFGDTGAINKYFTQESQLNVREKLFKVPDQTELQDVTSTAKWFTQQSSNLAQVAGFYIEDAYRRNVEPKFDEVLGRIKSEFGDWIDKVDVAKWRETFDNAIRFYQTNNADPFFSGLKQNVLENFPNSIKAESARNLIEKLGTKNEIEWTSGLKDFIQKKIENREKINKEELLEVIQNGQVRVEEKLLGQPSLTKQELEEIYSLNRKIKSGDYTIEEHIRYEELRDKNNFTETKYGLKDYSSDEKLELEGGENYKEMLLISPRTNRNIESIEKEWQSADEKVTAFRQEMSRKYDIFEKSAHLRGAMSDSEISIYNDLLDFREAIAERLLKEQNKLGEAYTGSHWDEENVLAHYRTNERRTIDGVSVLHSEEFQSDWNQTGRNIGYKDDSKEIDIFEARKGVKPPQNPFMENNWKELVFKRFLRQAIEEGKDGISWTTARQQQERYKKLIEGKDITWVSFRDDTYDIKLNGRDIGENISIDEIRRLTNNEVADKILQESTYNNRGNFKLEEAIKVGARWGIDYDTYFVNLAKKIGKNFDAKYEMKEIETKPYHTDLKIQYDAEKDSYHLYTEDGKVSEYVKDGEEGLRRFDKLSNQRQTEKVHFLEISPQMRDPLLKEGQTLYGTAKLPQLKPSQPTGIRNRIITRELFDQAKADITLSLSETADSGGIVFNSGLNPSAFLDQIKLLYKGWADFSSFSKDLTRRYGEKIASQVEPIWNWLKGENNKLYGSDSDERGFLRLKKSPNQKELKEFDEDRTSLGTKLSIYTKRGIALAQTDERFGEIYNVIRSAQRVTNAYSTTVLHQLQESVKLLQKSDTDNIVAKAIFERNKDQVNDPNEDTRIIAKYNLNPDQEAAYKNIRAAISNVLNLRRDTLLYNYHKQAIKLNEDLAKETLGTPKHDEILVKMGDLSDQMLKMESYYEDLKNSGYISLQRLGRIRVEAQDTAFPIGDDRRLLVDFVKTRKEADQLLTEWKNKYNLVDTKILDAHKLGDFEQWARKLTPSEFEEMVLSSGINLNDPRNADVVERLRKEIYEKYPAMSYQLKRKFYRGYQENNEFMLKSISHQVEVYSSSYYSRVAREEGLKALQDSGLENSDPTLAYVARQYIEDETTSPRYNWLDKAAFKARKFTFYMQLAWDVKQFYLNAFVQPVTSNYNYLARVENPLNGKRLANVQAEQVMVGGIKLALKMIKKGSLKTKEDKEFEPIYERLKLERVIEPEYTKSLLEMEAETPIGIDSKFKTGTKKFFSRKQQEHWAGIPMRAGEKVTRTHMAASMFLTGKKFGLKGEQLVDFIVRGIDATQTNPSRAENPLAIRKTGELGKLFYQFGAFRHMWFENLLLNVKSDWKHKSPASLSRQLVPLAITAGLKGLPLSGFAYLLYGLATGKNPDEEIRKTSAKYLGDNDLLENLALNGVTGNASFSQATGIQFPILDPAGDTLTQSGDIVDKLTSGNMPFVMTTKQIALGLAHVTQGLYKEDSRLVRRGIEEASPKVFRQPLKVWRVEEEGYRTVDKDVIVPRSKLSIPTNLATGVLGLTPNIVSKEYEERKFKKLRKSKLGKASRKLTRKILQ